MGRKSYFAESSLANIIKGREPVAVNIPHELSDKVMQLQDGQYLIVQKPLIPPQYSSPRKFLKHGAFVEIGTPGSVDEAVERQMYPWKLRREAFDATRSIYHPGYSFKPFANYHDDKRERRVRLVEICEALRILSYGEQTGNVIEIVGVYSQSERVSKDGAAVRVRVPSRTEKQPRYDFIMRSVVTDSNNPNSFAAANGFITNIKFPAKEWSFRYNFYDDKEDSDTVNIFAPEIAAYFKLMIQELNGQRPNMSLVAMTPFGIPTNLTVEFYKQLLSRVVMYDQGLKSKTKLRKLNKAEQEVMLWALVRAEKYEKTFFRSRKNDGHIENLDWKLVA